jgi:hypothetical protein
MTTPFKDVFMRRVREEWLPAYCNDPKRQYAVEGFHIDDNVVIEADAQDFLRAIDNGVAIIGDRQGFGMARGYASETLFWEHERTVQPRRITLWLETLITVATGARLHFDYGWPIECLGMQSKDSAFDLMTFKEPDFQNEYVAVEVKSTSRAVDEMTENLARCCAGDHDPSCFTGTRRNAHRKWIALTARRPCLFWAVGPSPASKLFQVAALADDRLHLVPVSFDSLRF